MAIEYIGGAVADGSTNAIDITHGLTIQSGDVVIAFINVNSTPTISDDNGSFPFTESFAENHPAGKSSTYAIFERVAGASEPATYSFALSGGQQNTSFILVFRGVDNTTLWDVAPSASTRSSDPGPSSTATAPTMTVVAGAMGLLLVGCDGDSVVFSSPTNSYTNLIQGGTGWPSRTACAANRVHTSAGATGSVDVTMSVTDDWFAHQISLNPASTGTHETIASTLRGYLQKSDVEVASTLRGYLQKPDVEVASTLRGYLYKHVEVASTLRGYLYKHIEVASTLRGYLQKSDIEIATALRAFLTAEAHETISSTLRAFLQKSDVEVATDLRGFLQKSDVEVGSTLRGHLSENVEIGSTLRAFLQKSDVEIATTLRAYLFELVPGQATSTLRGYLQKSDVEIGSTLRAYLSDYVEVSTDLRSFLQKSDVEVGSTLRAFLQKSDIEIGTTLRGHLQKLDVETATTLRGYLVSINAESTNLRAYLSKLGVTTQTTLSAYLLALDYAPHWCFKASAREKFKASEREKFSTSPDSCPFRGD